MIYTDLFSVSGWKTIGDDTQYLIHETEDEYVIAFYGSNSKADWKNNFAFRKKPYKNMPVPFSAHRGFLKAWKLINDHFISLVKDVSKPITVIGHSYGGAIATLCMEDLWFNYPEKRAGLKLITYGSPRIIGWKNYRRIKDRWENSTIYSNRIDLVSCLPPFMFGYRHVKKRTFINKDKLIKQFFKFVDNHMIWNYTEE